MPRKSIAAAVAAVALLSASFVPARAEPVKNVVIVHFSPTVPDGGA